MKSAILIIALMLVGSFAMAQGENSLLQIPTDFNAHQGMGVEWSTGALKNTTTFEVAMTVPNPKWSKAVNALWDGWTIDAGFAYDAGSADNAIIGISRTFGTLGQYLPIKFPLADKIQISITPLAMEFQHFTSGHLDYSGFSGGSYASALLKF